MRASGSARAERGCDKGVTYLDQVNARSLSDPSCHGSLSGSSGTRKQHAEMQIVAGRARHQRSLYEAEQLSKRARRTRECRTWRTRHGRCIDDDAEPSSRICNATLIDARLDHLAERRLDDAAEVPTTRRFTQGELLIALAVCAGLGRRLEELGRQTGDAEVDDGCWGTGGGCREAVRGALRQLHSSSHFGRCTHSKSTFSSSFVSSSFPSSSLSPLAAIHLTLP